MKRFLAIFLLIAMLISILPNVMAAEEEETAPTPEGINAEATYALLGAQESGAKVFEDTVETVDPEMPVRIVVVLDEELIPTDGKPTKAAQTKMLQQQSTVQQEISEKILGGQTLQIHHSYATLTNGFSATVTYAQLQEIRLLDSVVSAFAAPTFELQPLMTTSNSMVGGGVYNDTGYNGEGMVVAILDTGVSHGHEVFASAPKNPRLSRADIQKFLDENDMHCESDVPSVGASTLYYSEKIPYQFDYGDHDADGTPTEGGEHGTHVAATAAGNDGVKENFSGVAPEAQIVNMKVFMESGGASYDDILAALEDCMVLGVDSVNLSLGSDCGFIDYEDQDEWTMNLINVFNRTGESGICMAVAVGNAYSAAYNNQYGGTALASNPDYGNASEPATYDESLAVAAVENAGMIAPYITVNGRNIAYYDGFDGTTQEITTEYAFRTIANKGQLEYVIVPGYGAEEDYVGLDVKGKIAVVERGGGMYYETKCNNAYAAGAVGLIVYNNIPGMVYMSIDAWTIPIAFVSQQDGAYLKQQSNKVLTISTSDGLVASPVAGICDFSSWGATSELTLKPEITAPGGNIYSAIPGNSYELMSGTSMAAPHVAGGMAIILQAMKERYPILSAEELKDMVDTRLMATAALIYDVDNVPVSPRKQGAGMMNISAAVKSDAYITVSGMERPKMELGDDVAKTGVYTLNFTVHNDGDSVLFYKASPIVLTDRTEEEDGTVLMTEWEKQLSHSFTTNFTNDLVIVEPHSEVDVTITVTLTDPETELAEFINGAFVEGWAYLDQVNADGSEKDDGIDLNAPFLAFYGDWTQAPMIDSGFWWDVIANETTTAQQYNNEALLSSMEQTFTSYLGDNHYDFTIPYLADRNAISPNEDDFMDSLTYVYTGLLRSARYFSYEIKGEDGTVYYEKTVEYEPKSVYSNAYYSIVPAGAISDWGDCIDPWFGTDKYGSALPNNTKATVTVTAVPMYDAHKANNARDSWSFPITIDTEGPELLESTVREAEGRYYATLTFRDNQYAAAVVLTDAKYSKEYKVIGVGETQPGMTTVLTDLDVTGYGETVGVVIHDYAGNTKTYYLKVKGNTDDYADVVVTPDMVLYTEDFNGSWLPEGWSSESKSGAPNTWYRDDYYMAAIDPDDLYHQNEWLYSPSYDLSGLTTPTHMIFDFESSYTFCVQYPHFNVDVYASKDDGETWESIWNLRNSGLYVDWVRTQAKVVIPDAYQGCENVRFAFVYTGDTGGAQFAMDNVRIYKDRAEDYIAVTAESGGNGSLSPEGRVLVRKGTSKTFTAIPDAGYEVASMVVDGQDLGAISYYTFETVGVDHTISVSFRPVTEQADYTVHVVSSNGGTVTPSGEIKVEAGESLTLNSKASGGYQLTSVRVNGRSLGAKETVALENIDQNYYVYVNFELIPAEAEIIFEQDFESGTFPPTGWERKGGSETWRAYSYYYMDGSVNAYVSAGTGNQDEWLISPTVNLLGATDTNLEFDFAFPYYGMKRGEFTFTLLASVDGGSNWSVIWDAADAIPETLSGYVVTDRAFITLPEELLTGQTSFAWRYTRPAGDNSGIAAIDNIKLDATGVSTDVEGFAKITATAGEGGAITPAGRVYVEEGKSQTFTITPIVGYAISDVIVDGVSVGSCATYTFENVVGSHTIEAVFKLSSGIAGVLFENDFEDAAFPSRGWTVQSGSNSHNNWHQGEFGSLNKTKIAMVINDYEDWSNAPKQDEWLISPTVDLTGQEPVLSFDYIFGRYEVFRGGMTLTVEISTDGGEEWLPIWDASQLENLSGFYQSGHADVEIPSIYCKANVKIAFHYTKANGYEGDKAGIDNVSLSGETEGNTCEHSNTELRNAVAPTCTRDGYTGDTYCLDCGSLIAVGAVEDALGHDADAIAAVEPTCTERGNIAYWHCTVCDKYFSDEDCTREIKLEDTVLLALGHSPVASPAKEPTCTEPGNTAYWYCPTCKLYFSNAVCTKEIKLSETVIPALGHTIVLDPAVEPTCTEPGMTLGSHCDTCGHVFIAQDSIDPLGHDYGQWEIITDATCTADGEQSRICSRCEETETEVIPAFECPSAEFSDVLSGVWYHDAVDYMLRKELMNGMGEGLFQPEGELTRAQLVVILYRAAGSPEVEGTSAFTDVPDGLWYTDAIVWATESGVVNGIGEGLFAPDNKITREQIATILYRYAKAEPVGEDMLQDFIDVASVSSYALDALNWAVAEGLLNGADGMLMPTDNATRAQIAAILMRWMEK